MSAGRTIMIRLGACLIAMAAPGAVADPPIPPDPPVWHTNQGRNVDDEIPKIGSTPIRLPRLGNYTLRGIWIPPESTTGSDIDRLTLPEFPVVSLGERIDIGGSITVTPAPSTLGLLALGGLAMSRRRRRD